MQWESKISTSSTKFCVFSLPSNGRSEKQDGCPGLWLAETFLILALKTVGNGNETCRKQDLNTKSCVFPDLEKTRATLASDWLRHFHLWRFISETDLNVCVSTIIWQKFARSEFGSPTKVQCTPFHRPIGKTDVYTSGQSAKKVQLDYSRRCKCGTFGTSCLTIIMKITTSQNITNGVCREKTFQWRILIMPLLEERRDRPP